jgi:hypothetical protein
MWAMVVVWVARAQVLEAGALADTLAMADQSQADLVVTEQQFQDAVAAHLVKLVAAVLEFMVKERLAQMVYLVAHFAPVKVVAAAQMDLALQGILWAVMAGHMVVVLVVVIVVLVLLLLAQFALSGPGVLVHSPQLTLVHLNLVEKT